MKLTMPSKTVLGLIVFLGSFWQARQAEAAFDIGSKFGSQTVVGGNIRAFSDLSKLYNPVIFSLYTVGGIVTFFALMYGGFCYIMGAGQADQKKIEQGQQVMTWSLVGLAVLMSTFWILQIIEKVTGAQIINSSL